MVEGYPIKLVRDGIARVVPNVGGERLYFKPVGQTTHIRMLRQKLLEEVGEYLAEPSVEELVDVVEVVEALLRVYHGVGPREFLAHKQQKIRDRGGFMEGLVMYSGLVPEDTQGEGT